jgi:hypothetical protein
MSIKITRTFGDLKGILPEGVGIMREIGDFLVRKIRTRTEAETDYRGHRWHGLSPGYAEQKRAALGHTRADLTVSGRMLNDMQVVAADENSCEISFISQGGGGGGGTFIQRSRSLGAADKATFHVNSGRDFFGVSEDDERDVVAILERKLQENLDKL